MRRIYCSALILAIGGCAPATGHVTGTVTFNGEKVPVGTVAFVTAGKVVQGEIVDGQYDIDGVPIGPAIVTVVRLDPKQPDPYAALNKARQQVVEGKAVNPRDVDPKVVTDAKELEALEKKRHLLPLAYSSPQTSDLRYTVTGGMNQYDIPLKSTRP